MVQYKYFINFTENSKQLIKKNAYHVASVGPSVIHCQTSMMELFRENI